MSQSISYRGNPAGSETRSVLAITSFRKLWNSMAFSSFGDWLGLLASTAFAGEIAGSHYSKANYAIAGVFIVRLLPAVLLGPIAGVIADRFDRKRLMIFCDIIRFGLFFSIPLVGSLTWLYVATVLVEVVTLFWQPAKEASVPNLVPKHKLESANQLSLLAAYGTAPVAAIVFTFLAFVSEGLTKIFPNGYTTTADLGLFIDAVSFLYIAFTVVNLDTIPRGPAMEKSEDTKIIRSLIDGFQFVTQSKLIRGLIIGMLGAFFAAGAVIGLARTFVGDLGAGDAAYGILFASVFTGLALGIVAGPKLLSQFSRRRIFGSALVVASICLVIVAIVTNLVLAIIFTVLLGAFAGVSWVTGYTLLGGEVEDEIRGRTFAFVFSLTRISLVLVLAVAPIVAAAIGKHTFSIAHLHVAYNGAEFTMLSSGVIGIIVGVFSYHQMKDRPGISFFNDIRAALRGELAAVNGFNHTGLFVAFEGGEGSGKSTQSAQLKEYLESIGETVTLTREPGGTVVGNKLREILLSPETGNLSPRSEALMYAADRAHHVYSLIRPALEQGQVVITDRYIDSSIAYQGAGRVLEPSEVTRVSRWATENLTPNITIILDLPASVGLGRLTSRDRLEAEPVAFHERVRQEFLNLASLDPERYLVVDATLPPDQISALINERVSKHPALIINKKKSADKKSKK
jgi:dTMP kinase